jgi:hypothetical protein
MDPVHTAFLHTIVSGSQFTDEFGKAPELDFLETFEMGKISAQQPASHAVEA